jgi:hypothetical protein
VAPVLVQATFPLDGLEDKEAILTYTVVLDTVPLEGVYVTFPPLPLQAELSFDTSNPDGAVTTKFVVKLEPDTVKLLELLTVEAHELNGSNVLAEIEIAGLTV